MKKSIKAGLSVCLLVLMIATAAASEVRFAPQKTQAEPFVSHCGNKTAATWNVWGPDPYSTYFRTDCDDKSYYYHLDGWGQIIYDDREGNETCCGALQNDWNPEYPNFWKNRAFLDVDRA